jgi:N-acetylneuraminic acid mutarotase
MQKKSEHMTRGPNGGRGTLSRREVLAGAAIAALAASTPLALAAPARKGKQGFTALTPSQGPPRRYMAAAAALGDGRILVTGGYDRPWKDGVTSGALNSAMIYDPANGQWLVAASMSTPRARHAAVALADGRVAVLGGISMNATASVEIYDPAKNTWTVAAPLSQPRYDHSATVSGGQLLVIGGSSQSMLSSHETYDPTATSPFAPNTRSK